MPTVRSKKQRLLYTSWVSAEDAVLHKTWFPDEAHFHLNVAMNKQSIRFWATAQRGVTSQMAMGKVTIWMPFFFFFVMASLGHFSSMPQ